MDYPERTFRRFETPSTSSEPRPRPKVQSRVDLGEGRPEKRASSWVVQLSEEIDRKLRAGELELRRVRPVQSGVLSAWNHDTPRASASAWARPHQAFVNEPGDARVMPERESERPGPPGLNNSAANLRRWPAEASTSKSARGPDPSCFRDPSLAWRKKRGVGPGSRRVPRL